MLLYLCNQLAVNSVAKAVFILCNIVFYDRLQECLIQKVVIIWRLKK
jgi:hypothetical protein